MIQRPYRTQMTEKTPGWIRSYGCVLSNRGWNYGVASGDNYYIGVTASGDLYIGLQLNNAVDVTWKQIN